MEDISSPAGLFKSFSVVVAILKYLGGYEVGKYTMAGLGKETKLLWEENEEDIVTALKTESFPDQTEDFVQELEKFLKMKIPKNRQFLFYMNGDEKQSIRFLTKVKSMRWKLPTCLAMNIFNVNCESSEECTDLNSFFYNAEIGTINTFYLQPQSSRTNLNAILNKGLSTILPRVTKQIKFYDFSLAKDLFKACLESSRGALDVRFENCQLGFDDAMNYNNSIHYSITALSFRETVFEFDGSVHNCIILPKLVTQLADSYLTKSLKNVYVSWTDSEFTASEVKEMQDAFEEAHFDLIVQTGSG